MNENEHILWGTLAGRSHSSLVDLLLPTADIEGHSIILVVLNVQAQTHRYFSLDDNKKITFSRESGRADPIDT